MWSVPAYLRRCAPWLGPDDVRLLQRADPQPWTVCDLPLLDAARQRLGDPLVARRRRRYDAAVAAQREHMADVIDELITADGDGEGLMTSLRQPDLRDVLVDDTALPEAATTPDRLAGPFAHIVVDEAPELTDAEWQMLLPSRSSGPRCRTPTCPRRSARPTSRSGTVRPRTCTGSSTPGWPTTPRESLRHRRSDAPLDAPVWSLAPELAKGLEFGLVALVDPQRFGEGIEAAVDRYVAMTRAPHQLVVLTS